MLHKFVLLAALGLAACVPALPEEPEERLVRVRVEAPAKMSYDRLKRAAQQLADTACVAGQERADWVATISEPGSTTSRFMFVCR